MGRPDPSENEGRLLLTAALRPKKTIKRHIEMHNLLLSQDNTQKEGNLEVTSHNWLYTREKTQQQVNWKIGENWSAMIKLVCILYCISFTFLTYVVYLV